MNNAALIEKAKEGMAKSYAPYSKFQVGAALLSKSGNVYLGCNIENASYGGCICAERVAFVKAISDGEKNFEAIAIVGSNGDFTYPCGICRQFMSEFGLGLRVIVEKEKDLREHVLKDLLPEAFTSF